MEIWKGDIEQVVTRLTDCGLYEPGISERITRHFSQHSNYDEFNIERELAGTNRLITLDIHLVRGEKLKFTGYQIWVRMAKPYPGFSRNGIHTKDLENILSEIDWKQHPGIKINEALAKGYPKYQELYSAFNALDKFYGNDFFECSNETLNLIRTAMTAIYVRHFSGTPVEKQLLAESPYLRTIFFQRHYFKPEIHINSLINIIDKPAALASSKQFAMAAAIKQTKNMNTQNLEFLNKTLLNLGFGEKVNDLLKQNISENKPEFALLSTQTYNQKEVAYALHFKAGSENENYFFNKFDAALNEKPDEKQTFYINKGNGITAKEAFNLMEGRAVYKQLYNKESEKYNAWVKLDSENLTEGGNKKFKQWNDNYGYDPENLLKGKNIKEMDDGQNQANLMRSLKKGNAQQITATIDGKEQKFYISASPQFKTVDLYDDSMKRIKREVLLPSAQKEDTSKKQSESKKEANKEQQDQPSKKSTKRKVSVS